MMEFTEKALVLQVGRFRESDMWVRFLTPSRGPVTAFAFGGSKSRRRFCGCLDPFNQVLFRVKGNRAGTYLCLQEGSLLQGRPRLRTDCRRLGMAVNCLKFQEAAPMGSDGASAAYGLLLETLDALEAEENLPPLFPLLFRVRVAYDQGYGPDLHSCYVCGAPGEDSADPHVCVEQGRLACRACCPSDGLHLRAHAETLQALDYVRRTGPSLWGALELSPRARRECSSFIDAFVAFHLGLVWDRGRFRRN